MKLPKWTRAFPWTTWAAVGAIIVGALLILWLITEPGRQRQRVARANADATFAEGRADAAKDAIKGVEDNRAKADAIADKVKDAENAVRNADPAQRDDTALRELCGFESARDLPECAVFRSGGRDKPR